MSRPASTPLMAEVDPAHPNLTERVRAEQIRMVYLHSPTTTAGSLVAGAFLIAVMWNTVWHAILLGWGAALAVHQAFRIYTYRQYLAANPDLAQSRYWGRLYILATTIAGCIWGGAGLLFYVPESTISLVYLCLVLFGVVSLTIPTLSLFAPAFYPLVVLVLVPFIVRSFASGGTIRTSIKTMTVAAGILKSLACTYGPQAILFQAIGRQFAGTSATMRKWSDLWNTTVPEVDLDD